MPRTAKELDNSEIEERADAIRDDLRRTLASAATEPILVLRELIDRLAVDIIVERPNRSLRQVYRVLIDYLEDVADDRTAAADQHRHPNDSRIQRYLSDLFKGFEDD